MSDLNKWLGSGRLTRDTELRFTPNGTPVADLSMCANRTYVKDGNKVDDPVFVDVTLWGKQAEVLTQYLKKGTFVIIDGRLELDVWETDDGSKRSKLKVVANQVNLGPKTGGGSGGKKKTSQKVEEDTPF